MDDPSSFLNACYSIQFEIKGKNCTFYFTKDEHVISSWSDFLAKKSAKNCKEEKNLAIS